MSKRVENNGLPIYAHIEDVCGNYAVRVATLAQKDKRQRANRAEVIALLGLRPEAEVGDHYVGSTRELWQDYRAKRRATAQAAG
jgi:hypothetical protein